MAVLERRADNVEIRGGKVQSRRFTINATADAFEILSDRIYPNKVKAVVRELTTNAVDATIDARKVKVVHTLVKQGKSLEEIAAVLNENTEYVEKELQTLEQFPNYDLTNWEEKSPVIHLPNSNEPFFSVRDYGTGLAHDLVMELYTAYFWSNKQTSNDYTGCLGLGSKSPFAYTDHFTVTSYWNGEKRIYVARLKDGFPDIDIFINEETGEEEVYPTDEPNGLEVQLAVQGCHFDSFAEEAKTLYPNFRHKLEIVGNSYAKTYIEDILNAKAEGTYYLLEGSENRRWGFRPNGGNETRAIMGNIAYPISLSYDAKSGLSAGARLVLESGIDIYFNLGELQITPSREHLSYKESTIAIVRDAAEKVAAEITPKVLAQMDDCKTLWEARCKANKIIDSGRFGKFLNILNSDGRLRWNGEVIKGINSVSVESLKDKEQVIVYKFSTDDKRREATMIPCNSDIVMYEVDLPQGSFTRCEILCRQLNKTIFAVSFANAEAKIEFFKTLGMPEDTVLPGTSTLPKPAPAERKKYTSDGHIFEYSYNSYDSRQYRQWDKLDAQTFDFSGGGVYVEMVRHKAVLPNGKEIHPSELNEILELIKKIKENVPQVIGVRRKMIEEFKQSDDWVDLYTYVRNIMKQKDAKLNFDLHLSNVKHISGIYSFDNYNNYNNDYKLIVNDVVAAESSFRQFLAEVSEMGLSRGVVGNIKYDDYINLAQRVGYVHQQVVTHNIEEKLVELYKRYPMLEFAISCGYGDSHARKVCDYIALLDKTATADIMVS